MLYAIAIAKENKENKENKNKKKGKVGNRHRRHSEGVEKRVFLAFAFLEVDKYSSAHHGN
jgi:hypothetical protein